MAGVLSLLTDIRDAISLSFRVVVQPKAHPSLQCTESLGRAVLETAMMPDTPAAVAPYTQGAMEHHLIQVGRQMLAALLQTEPQIILALQIILTPLRHRNHRPLPDHNQRPQVQMPSAWSLARWMMLGR